MKYPIILSFFFAFLCYNSYATVAPIYHLDSPEKGQGALEMLEKYKLLAHRSNIDMFYEINNLNSKDPIQKGKKYKLPILIYKYNGKSIRSTIGISDYDHAVRIQEYNIWLFQNKIVDQDYRNSKVLWVPYHESASVALVTEEVEEGYLYESLFGEKYAKFKQEGNSLKGKVYYLVSGHGGPDPGAMGKADGNILCEDEYAYDVTLRLARLLMAQGATVYNIIQDKNDGIRDEKYLKMDRDEVSIEGEQIPLNQVARLKQRANIINKYFWQNQKKGLTDQTVVVIHVDSRHAEKRQDVFFVHHEKSAKGKELAENLRDTFSSKYSIYRKSGNYEGDIQTRNLFMLRETLPATIFIELANIRNPEDQKRIILSSNREALAEWMYEGLIK